MFSFNLKADTTFSCTQSNAQFDTANDTKCLKDLIETYKPACQRMFDGAFLEKFAKVKCIRDRYVSMTAQAEVRVAELQCDLNDSKLVLSGLEALPVATRTKRKFIEMAQEEILVNEEQLKVFTRQVEQGLGMQNLINEHFNDMESLSDWFRSSKALKMFEGNQ